MTVGTIWGQRRFLWFLPSGKQNFLRYFSPSSGLIGVYWRETLCNLVSLCLPRLVMIFIKHSTYSAPSPGFLVTIGEHTSSHFCCSSLGHCNLVGIKYLLWSWRWHGQAHWRWWQYQHHLQSLWKRRYAGMREDGCEEGGTFHWSYSASQWYCPDSLGFHHHW